MENLTGCRQIIWHFFDNVVTVRKRCRGEASYQYGISTEKAPPMYPPGSVVDPRTATQASRSFNWFLASTFISAVGRNGYQIGCAWILVTQGYGAAAVAAFFAIISVTELLTSPFAGWLSDRYDRRLLCVVADVFRFAGALALAVLLIVIDTRWAIWLSAILFATCDRIALTSSQSMIPAVGAGLSLPAANSMVFFLMQSGSLAAAVLTGVLLHFSIPTYTFTLLAAAFVLSVCFMLAVRRELSPQSGTGADPRSAFQIDAHLLQLGAIYALLYTGGVLVSVTGPSFVFVELAGDAIDFGQLEGAWSAGSILGTLLLIPLIRAVRISILQLVILALTAISFALLKVLDIPWALLIFAILGALYNLGRVGTEVMLQSSVPQTALGRAKGALHSVGVLLGVVLFGVVAAVGDEIAPSTIFLAFSFILAVGTLVLTICRVADRRWTAGKG
ncbi:MFS transporter [Shinella sp. YE25]|nr:MFS transporter [Shinella sp. YE25]CAI0333986.1 conserved membrane hypothetical protein [Rhizobiaceae bacterium]CAK7261632.1 MFS transporter [Shinella sp. WSC3-e]